jgi:phage I-like protein
MSATSSALGFAALSRQLNSDSQTSVVLGEDGYIQALPDGAFAAVDGRPLDVKGGKWLMDREAFAALQANTPHQAGDLVIDYEHQTLNKDSNGQPAPAAGWFNITDVAYRPGQGLFIKPRFTDNATAFLSAKEYKYFSLVFGYDTHSGRPQYIHSAALTNRPALDGLLPLAQLTAAMGSRLPAQLTAATSSGLPAEANTLKTTLTQLSATPLNKAVNPTQLEELHVNPLLKKLMAALGIEVAEDATVLSADQETAALSALDELATAAASVDGLNQKLAVLTAKDPQQGNIPAGQVDLSQFVPVATVDAMREQLASLSAQNGQLTIEQSVKQALDEGRVLACEQDYLILLGKQQGFAALTAHLASRNPINALTRVQTNTVVKPTDKSALAVLSAEEKHMADAWGMSYDDFAKAKADDANAN